MPILDSSPSLILVWALVGYLIGSIPFGVLLTRLFGLGDLRQIGSGNIGATNVLRTGNKMAAALTLLLDGAKGALALLLARWIGGAEDITQIAALAAMLGHCFPVWLGFRGGKGVATFLGIMLALSWPIGLSCCAVWLVTAVLSRISSLSALIAAGASTFFVVFFGYAGALLLGILLTLLVWIRHRENIQRIKAGTEPKIGQSA